MFEIVTLEQERKWSDIVVSFRDYDVYYLSGYVKAFKLHGDGEPLLLHYDDGHTRGICVVMKRVIDEKLVAKTDAAGEVLYDVITPYGYGGFIFEGDTSSAAMNLFYSRYTSFMRDNRMITGVFRFHPQLNNAEYIRGVAHVCDRGKTIEMQLTDSDDIFKNLSGKNRNMIRKAVKSGVTIEHGHGKDFLPEFKKMYDGTMERDQARQYYFFDEAFYESIYEDLKDNSEFFFAMYDDKMISAAIILYAGSRMHYHLSGSYAEYRNLAPGNLLLYEAACWGAGKGLKTFHLGGGVGSREDNLFKFKQSFNPNGIQTFSISEQVYDPDMNTQLIDAAAEVYGVNRDSAFFPVYRDVF